MTVQRRDSSAKASLATGIAMVITMVHGPSASAEGPAPGRAVYDKWCAPCHDPGVSHPGTHSLTVKYHGAKSGVLLEWTDLPVSNVKHFVRHGISSMPPFRKTEINDAELDALAQYLARNTRAS